MKGFPEEIALTFLSHCASRDLLKSLKKLTEQFFSSFDKREAEVDMGRVKKYLSLFLEELIRPKDGDFKKIKILLFYVHQACKQLYPNAEEAVVVKYGVVNLMFRYLLRVLDDPYSSMLHSKPRFFPFLIIEFSVCLIHLHFISDLLTL